MLQAARRLIFMDAAAVCRDPALPAATPTRPSATLGYNAMARLAAGRVDAFAAAAAYLRSRGLSAPEVKALDAERAWR